MEITIKTILIGIGGTFAMDVLAFVLHTFFNVKSLDYSLVGRWVGHFSKGKFFHNSILKAKPIANELIFGWIAHYLIGISFAFLLIGIYGGSWLQKPTLIPALLIGIVTVVAPFFIMQPSMGIGIAASNLPEPNIARFKSLLAHSIYGIGLYISAVVINSLWNFFKNSL